MQEVDGSKKFILKAFFGDICKISSLYQSLPVLLHEIISNAHVAQAILFPTTNLRPN